MTFSVEDSQSRSCSRKPTSRTFFWTSPVTRSATHEADLPPLRAAPPGLPARPAGALLQPHRAAHADGDLRLPEPRRFRARDARHRRSGEESVERAARPDPEGHRDVPGDRATRGPG